VTQFTELQAAHSRSVTWFEVLQRAVISRNTVSTG